jgi:hypothetical protein
MLFLILLFLLHIPALVFLLLLMLFLMLMLPSPPGWCLVNTEHHHQHHYQPGPDILHTEKSIIFLLVIYTRPSFLCYQEVRIAQCSEPTGGILNPDQNPDPDQHESSNFSIGGRTLGLVLGPIGWVDIGTSTGEQSGFVYFHEKTRKTAKKSFLVK